MSPQKKIQLGIFVTLLVLAAVIAAATLSRPAAPPSITGVIIPSALPLKDFLLVDHHNRKFTGQDLLGKWHIVSYGYTYCPDICPTTLTTLAQVATKIERDREFDDVGFLFYTVDPERDTTDRLAEYVTWFNSEFVGLARVNKNDTTDLSFEQSLGILAVLTPLEMDQGLEDVGGYSVSHGVSIFLLNSEGKLQAVFKPQVDKDGTQFFTVEQLYGDYRKVRRHLG